MVFRGWKKKGGRATKGRRVYSTSGWGKGEPVRRSDGEKLISRRPCRCMARRRIKSPMGGLLRAPARVSKTFSVIRFDPRAHLAVASSVPIIYILSYSSQSHELRSRESTCCISHPLRGRGGLRGMLFMREITRRFQTARARSRRGWESGRVAIITLESRCSNARN